MSLPIILISTGLFDSFATTFQIIIFILLLSTKQPLPTALSFFAGVTLVYFSAGIVLEINIESLQTFIKPLIDQLASVNDNQYYLSELFSSLIILLGMPLYFFLEKRSTAVSPLTKFSALFAKISPKGAFIFGVIFQITNLAGSFPYFFAVMKIHEASLTPFLSFVAIAGYNLAYALPTVVILVIYLLYRHHENIEQRLHHHAQRTNRQITIWSLVGISLVLVLDAALYFARGVPLFQRFF